MFKLLILLSSDASLYLDTYTMMHRYSWSLYHPISSTHAWFFLEHKFKICKHYRVWIKDWIYSDMCMYISRYILAFTNNQWEHYILVRCLSNESTPTSNVVGKGQVFNCCFLKSSYISRTYMNWFHAWINTLSKLHQLLFKIPLVTINSPIQDHMQPLPEIYWEKGASIRTLVSHRPPV